jgi:hypothetical protein
MAERTAQQTARTPAGGLTGAASRRTHAATTVDDAKAAAAVAVEQVKEKLDSVVHERR